MAAIRRYGTWVGLVVTAGVLLSGAVIGVGGWPGVVSSCVAAGECSCEALRSGLVAQPANAVTSLFFVIAALVALSLGKRRFPAGTVASMDVLRMRTFGAALLLTGWGSAAFHSSLTEWGGWADLVGAAAPIGFAIAHRTTALRAANAFRLTFGAILVGVAALLWVLGTRNGKWVLAGLVLVAIVLELRSGLGSPERRKIESWWLGAAASAFLAGAAVWWLSRDGYPLCDPTSIWQWHGIWHLLAAGGLLCLLMYWRSEHQLTVRG